MELQEMQLRMLRFKGGLDMLQTVFKRWTNRQKFGVWAQWMGCVAETRQEQVNPTAAAAALQVQHCTVYAVRALASVWLGSGMVAST